jgi:hypothetical protein
MRRPPLTPSPRSTLIRGDRQQKRIALQSLSADPAASERILNERGIDPAPDRIQWLLFLLPLLLMAANSGWFYNSPGHIDPWVYFGYFLHFVEFKSRLFPNLYYGSRLPWILPGYLAHRFFDVTTARYVLHFAFYYVATFSIYTLLKRAFGRKNALLGAVVFGTHAAFLSSIGWDYVDGAGITYNLLALACISRASIGRQRQLWLVFAGIASIAMVYMNLMLIAFLPLHLAYYLFLTSTGFNRRVIGSMTDLLVWYAGGALFLTVALGAINYRLDGSFWFYAPSINALLHFSSAPNPWRLNGLAWFRQAYWLGIPAATTVACIASVLRGPHRGNMTWGAHKTFYIWQYLASVTFMVVWYTVGGVGLQLNYYVSYLLPSMFLAIGGILAVPADGWRPHAWWPVVAGTTIALAVALRLSGGPITQLLQSKGLVAIVACTTTGLLARIMFPRAWWTVVPALAGVILFQLAYTGFIDSPSNRESTERIVAGVRAAWPYMQKGKAFFWYDITEPHGYEFNGINATYLWGYTFASQKFPLLDDAHPIASGETIVVMSGSAQALERANKTLLQRHLKGSLLEAHKIQVADVAYDMTILKIQDDPPNLRSLTIAQRGATANLIPAVSGDNAELPLSGWKAGSMEQRPEGLLVTTGKKRFAYGSWYGPLVAPRSGKYQFTLTYRVFEGRILYGGMAADMSHALGRAQMPPQTGRSQAVTYVAQLKAGEGAVLLIANDAMRVGASAKYLVESVRADASFDEDAQTQPDAHESKRILVSSPGKRTISPQ